MYTCVHAYMRVCVCPCLHARLCVHGVCVCVYACMGGVCMVYVCMYMHRYVCICMDVCGGGLGRKVDR